MPPALLAGLSSVCCGGVVRQPALSWIGGLLTLRDVEQRIGQATGWMPHPVRAQGRELWVAGTQS